jgi:hypothetical protein
VPVGGITSSSSSSSSAWLSGKGIGPDRKRAITHVLVVKNGKYYYNRFETISAVELYQFGETAHGR